MTKLRCPVCGRSIRFLKDHIARFHPEHLDIPPPPKPKIFRPSPSTWTSNNKYSEHRKNRTLIIVVDGQNVAYYGDRSKPSFLNLKIVYEALKLLGYTPKFVISAALKYKIDDPARLNRLISRDIAIEAPSGEDDDLTILELANTYQTKIITNDRYLDHTDLFPTLKNQLVKFQIIGRTVSFFPQLKSL
ncbi:MAG: hypothetical protein ACFFBD_12810 [Candidatus Hodarchaeota archaeon]